MKWIALSEVAHISRGVTYSALDASDILHDGHIGVLRAGNIQDTLYTDKDLVFIPKSIPKKDQLIKAGDIVMCASSGSSDLVGKCAIAQEDAYITIGGFCLLIRSKRNISDPFYIKHYFKSDLFRRWAKQSQGVNIKNIRKNELEELVIPLPPLDEQYRIAAILEKADVVRRKRQDALKLANDFLKSTFIDMFGDPITNPRGWIESPLSEVSDITSGVTKGKSYKEQKLISIPYMRVANVQDGNINLDEIKEITVSKSDAEKFLLSKGDLLLTEGGDPDKLGRGAVWHGEISPCIHQNHIFRVRFGSNILPEFASALIGSKRGKKYFLSAAKQTTGIASINKTQLSNFPMLIPEMKMQSDFSQIVSKIRKITDHHLASLKEISHNISSLQQQFFSKEHDT